MWRSLPRTVREQPGNKRVEALRRRAEQTGAVAASIGRPGHQEEGTDQGGGPDTAVVIAVILAVLFVICAVIGFVTLLRWIIPG
jgi:hypothetical protein